MRGLIVCVMVALLAGCGDAKKSFEDSFNKSFHEKFVESCVKSAAEAGAPQDMAVKLCDCGVKKVDHRFSISEKMSLKPEQLSPIVEECRAEVQG